MPLASGVRLGPYEIDSLLGAGGMGEVYKARDTRLGRTVALKMLPPEQLNDPERKLRLLQEAKAVSALNHPNIVVLHDIATEQGANFLVMEYVQGHTVHELMRRHGLRMADTLDYAIQIADALAAAHAAGIVHRDIKPGNIIVTESGAVKLLDFGLAKLAARLQQSGDEATRTIADAPKSLEGTIAGTVAYMSPEQAEGKSTDARTDIFSFGAVLYEMLTGRRAFSGDSTISTLSAVLRDQPKPPVELVQGLPRQFDRIVARCLQKDPHRRYQHAGDLKLDLQQVKDEPAAGDSAAAAESAAQPGVSRRWWLAAIAAAIAVSFAIGWWLHSPQAAPPSWRVTRLTSDAGLSNSAALSPDGKLVAYSSDRSLEGERDLYIKQVAGGQPIRLTSDGANNTMPDFSPDGSKIVFRSNREGGGIYEIPAFGGEVKPLAREGWLPKYSPDGSQVAYWVGARHVASAVPASGAVWVVPVAGGSPQRVGPNFTTARNPIWSPDGKHLLFIGYTSPKAYDSAAIDWWFAPTNGGEAVRTGARAALVQAGLEARDSADVPSPGCWSAANTVVFSLINGSTQNLWEIGISPGTGKVDGAPRRLTTGAGNETAPSCAPGGALAFTNVENRTDVWLLPFDLDGGTSKGPLERITQGPASREHASLANNGRYVAFASNQSGQVNIWRRELATGKESIVSGSSFAERYPVINASGSRVAYSVYEKDKRTVYVAAPGGVPEKMCEGCLRAADWSGDEKTLLVFGGNPYQVNLLDIASRRQTPLLKHPKYHLLYARFSPDNRWVSFTVRTQPNRGRIAVAPIDGPKPVPESAWITIAETGAEDWANWSPDGHTLYFTSPQDGNNCLWGQRLDAGTRHPVGEAFAVQHLHGRVSFQQGGWSAAGGRIAMVLDEATGNIWMMSRPSASR